MHDVVVPGSPRVPVVHIEAVDRVRARVWVLVLPGPHGILVHGGVGLGGGVVTRGQAVTGLTAVVAVPVIYSAVLVI